MQLTEKGAHWLKGPQVLQGWKVALESSGRSKVDWYGSPVIETKCLLRFHCMNISRKQGGTAKQLFVLFGMMGFFIFGGDARVGCTNAAQDDRVHLYGHCCGDGIWRPVYCA